MGRVSWDGVAEGSEESVEEAMARAIPFEIDDGRSDVGSSVSEDREAEAPSEDELEVREVAITLAVRTALAWLDHVNLVQVFQRRAFVMKSVPKFLIGAFCIALRTALQEAVLGGDEGDDIRQMRGWKLLLLLPRMLLSTPPRGA